MHQDNPLVFIVGVICSTDPSAWHSTGLSYNAPNCYACAELMALGLNKACVLSTPKCRSCKHVNAFVDGDSCKVYI